MALRGDTAEAMAGAFFDALQLEGQPRVLARAEFEQLAPLLPEPTAWAVGSQGQDGALLLLTADALFAISRRAPGSGDPSLTVTCRRPDVTMIGYERAGQAVSWGFELRQGDPVAVEEQLAEVPSKDAAEPYDRAGAFARALAAHGGWTTHRRVRGEAAPERPPDEEEPPDSGPADPRAQRVTDLWGNPMGSRRRRR